MSGVTIEISARFVIASEADEHALRNATRIIRDLVDAGRAFDDAVVWHRLVTSAALRHSQTTLEELTMPIEHKDHKFYVETILRSGIRNAIRLHAGKPAWHGVAEVFGFGATAASVFCEALGFDPESGEDLQPWRGTPPLCTSP